MGSLLQKPPTSAMPYADWFKYRDVTCHCQVVMHVVFTLLRIFMQAEEQACKQMQCSNAILSDPASIKGFHNSRF